MPENLVSRTVNKFSIMDTAFDLGGGFNPAKGLSVVVPVGEVAGDGRFQTADAVKAAAADGRAGNQGKPAFDQIEPRGAGRREVQMEARMGGAPRQHRGMLVGTIVVADQV